jgi:hypothetical protein
VASLIGTVFALLVVGIIGLAYFNINLAAEKTAAETAKEKAETNERIANANEKIASHKSSQSRSLRNPTPTHVGPWPPANSLWSPHVSKSREFSGEKRELIAANSLMG